MKNTTYRKCFDTLLGNCPFACYNKYGVKCCSIDGIVQIKFYGCTPQNIINKISDNFDEK